MIFVKPLNERRSLNPEQRELFDKLVRHGNPRRRYLPPSTSSASESGSSLYIDVAGPDGDCLTAIVGGGDW